MASTFQIPLHFEDLFSRKAEQWQVAEQRNSSIEELLDVAQSDLQSILECSAPPNEPFIALYNAVWRYSKGTQNDRKKSIKAVGQLALKATPSNATHVKIATFFLAGLAAAAEAVAKRCKHWDKTGRETVLETLLGLVGQVPTPSPFSAADTDKLAGLLQRATIGLLGTATAAKDKQTRVLIARVLAVALKLDSNQSVAATSALIHALFRNENIAIPVAEVVHVLATECEQVTFCQALVREIASLDTEALAKDTLGAKSFSTVICAIAERDHEVIKNNLAGLLAHLDGPSYMMRNGIVHAIGILIRENPHADDPLLDVLADRAMKDVNAFTRSKALQAWAQLAMAKVIPIKLFPKVCSIAASRLDDKGSVVRKSAAQLLGTLLQTNPFGPALKLAHFEAKLEEETKLAELREKTASEERAQAMQNGEDGAEEAEDDMEDDAEKEDDEDTRRLKYYAHAVAYIKNVEEGLSKVYGLLRSKSITDINEGVNFLVTAIQFQLDAASGKAVRAMLPLALAREANIRAAAVKAYVTLLNPAGEGVEEKESAMAVTNGLVALATGATMGEVACLEALVTQLSTETKESGVLITQAVITVTWDLFSGKVPGATTEQRNGACMLIGMFASTFPDSLLSRVSILEDVGFNQAEYRQWACAALCRLPAGCDTDTRISNRVIELCKNTMDLAVIDRAVTAVYRLHPNPENDIAQLIGYLAGSMREKGKAVPINELSRFLVIIGQVAVKQLVRVESLVKAVKRAKDKKADNEDIERAAAEADDMLLHAEKELVAPESLLGRWGGLAARISANKDAPAKLRAAAVLCMTKLMCLQADYCYNNLQLLFTILETAPQPHVRSNAVTALGDLAYRFPNHIEPWSDRIYAALRDKHRQVRTNTLMALTHLILNDQIKVKGQIVEIAICLLDEETRIADLARIFFHELARKNKNSIYNHLPDTISCLGRKVNSTEFKTVIGFLIGLLDKEKHHEGMIDKLCHRFRAVQDVQGTRDLAYCIAELNLTENGVKKLNDNYKSYANALVDDAVYKMFAGILAKGRKVCTSANGLQVIEEVSAKIEGQRKTEDELEDVAKGEDKMEDEAVEMDTESEVSTRSGRKSSRSSTASATSAATSKPRRRSARKSASKKETESVKTKAKPKRPARKRTRVIVDESSDEDTDIDIASDSDEDVAASSSESE